MLPELNSIRKAGTDISVFRGLNRTVNTGFSRVNRGGAYYTEFADMKNMGSDEFPQLSTRKKRATVSRTGASAIVSNLLVINSEIVYLTADGKLHAGSRVTTTALTGFDGTAEAHYLTQYGNNVVVMPETIKINMTDFSIERLNNRKAMDNTYDNEWLYGLNNGYVAYQRIAGDEYWYPCTFSIEKVIPSATGEISDNHYYFAGGYQLDNTDMQGKFEHGRPRDGQDWANSHQKYWEIIEENDIIEAGGERPSGMYKCVEIEDTYTTQNGYTADNKICKLVKLDSYYVKITRKKQGETVGAFVGLRTGDWVKICNMSDSTTLHTHVNAKGKTVRYDWGNYLDVLNNKTFKLYGVADDYIIIKADLEKSVPYNGNMTVERVMPEADAGLLIEVNNRLWTCSSAANEIYACKQGDALSWQAYGDGISTDSFAATVGCEGSFTGIARQGDSVIFFKENHILKLYGNKPSNYTLSVIDAPGVESGSEKSLVWIKGAVYYLSHSGVCRYVPGGQPVVISLPAFGNRRYRNAVAGRHKDKYVISAQNSSGTYEMFCFDTDSGMWHKEDDTQMMSCATYNDLLYFVDGAGALRCMEADGNLLENETGYTAETAFDWAFETGDMYSSDFGKKYISKVLLAVSECESMKATILAQFERGGQWAPIRTITYNRRQLYVLPVAVRRSDYLKLRVEGRGHCVISGIRIEFAGGSSKICQY